MVGSFRWCWKSASGVWISDPAVCSDYGYGYFRGRKKKKKRHRTYEGEKIQQFTRCRSPWKFAGWYIRTDAKKEKDEQDALEAEKKEFEAEQIKEDEVERFPKELQDLDLEEDYIGLLLYDPRYIVSYNFLYDEVCFQDERMLNLYKSVIFTEGEKYAPEAVKRKFNFAKTTREVYELKKQLVTRIKLQRTVTMEKVYIDLKKLFILRNWYLKIPIKSVQEKVVEIRNYELYDKMSVEEVESAVEQVTATEKFKRAVLNKGLTEFLETGENNLTTGIPLPFERLSKEFKGLRKGETMAVAMPSNSGKSRFTINLVANLSLVHKKRVLVISNEMSEEKMKLCLMTTKYIN